MIIFATYFKLCRNCTFLRNWLLKKKQKKMPIRDVWQDEKTLSLEKY